MKVLVTGAEGFIGVNLRLRLSREKDIEILGFDVANDPAELPELLGRADAAVHLAGINRPLNPEEFMTGNFGLTSRMAEILEKAGRKLPVIFASSIHAATDNEYGKSKRAAEDRLRLYSERTGAPVKVFRFANVFGKWCRPNYNSAVATFCFNMAHGLPIIVRDPDAPLSLLYVDDAVEAIVRELRSGGEGFAFVEAGPVYGTTVGKTVEMIGAIHEARQAGKLIDFSDALTKKMNTTYLSYVDIDRLGSVPEMKRDQRGWLFELIKSDQAGQVFVSTTKPGAKRGNHYHDTKVEKFCLVKGRARISLRKANDDNRIDIEVDDGAIRIVDIPPGYTHSIKNTGPEDCVVLFWANEIFDPSRSDTFFEEV